MNANKFKTRTEKETFLKQETISYLLWYKYKRLWILELQPHGLSTQGFL